MQRTQTEPSRGPARSSLTCSFMARSLSLIDQLGRRLAWLPPTAARMTVGWIFVQSGWGKLHNLEAVVKFFTDLGIPAPQIQAPFVAGTELVCGTLVLAGLATRFAAVPLIGVMAVALTTALSDKISELSDLFALAEF